MENPGLELGDVDMVQESVKCLLCRLKNEDNHTNRFIPSICMAPGILRGLSPNSFNPRVVSIGPLHKEDENVKAFEGQKISYLINLMSRIPSSQEEILKSCMEKAYASMNKIKAYYVWTKTYDDVEIAEMMVMDACFILEFIQKIPISCMENMLQVQTIMCDLMLLENQIPFFILDEIFQCTILKFNPDASLVELIQLLVDGVNLIKVDIKINNISIDTTRHILGLVDECYAPQDYINIISQHVSSTHLVVDLDMVGVKIQRNQNPAWVMGMEVKLYRLPCFLGFWSKPTLRMPVLHVHDNTEMLLRNLIAYEQSFQTRNSVTSYAMAMDMLVNTQEDVAKLVDARVLNNIMGSNEEAANMINNICRNVSCVDFYYKEQWEILDKYCNSYWPKNIAWLRRTYFSSPWNIIALVAGIILFALTVVQTIFTIKPAGSNK